MVLGQVDQENGGLVAEVGVEFFPTEAGRRRMQGRIGQVELAALVIVFRSEPVTSAEIAR